ncbi:MAG: hypothetical protein LLG06_06270 [Desulfobacteraceae bacterium]|nr:hypothetical protein [Desulfobacteraceae bacterium]
MKTRLRANSKNVRTLSLFLILLAMSAAFALSASAVQQPVPPPPPQAPAAPGPVAPQPEQTVPVPDNLAAPNPNGPATPSEHLPFIKRTASALMAEGFTFVPVKSLDPFMPFIQPDSGARLGSEEEDEPRAEGDKPLTPLQKMNMGEIERGLKAIIWGALGTKAVIEDSTGKGYIVAVGTPLGERHGVVKVIEKDRLVIEQQLWDRKEKKRLPQEVIVKLSKKSDKGE